MMPIKHTRIALTAIVALGLAGTPAHASTISGFSAVNAIADVVDPDGFGEVKWNISVAPGNAGYETHTGAGQSVNALPTFVDYGFFSGDGSGNVVEDLGLPSPIINGAASITVQDGVSFDDQSIVEIWDGTTAPPSPLSSGVAVEDGADDSNDAIKAGFNDLVTLTLDVASLPQGTVSLFFVGDTDAVVELNASLDGVTTGPFTTSDDGVAGTKQAYVATLDYAYDGVGDSTLTVSLVGKNPAGGGADMFFSGVGVVPEPASLALVGLGLALMGARPRRPRS